jgi:hypothetical protein
MNLTIAALPVAGCPSSGIGINLISILLVRLYVTVLLAILAQECGYGQASASLRFPSSERFIVADNFPLILVCFPDNPRENFLLI